MINLRAPSSTTRRTSAKNADSTGYVIRVSFTRTMLTSLVLATDNRTALVSLTVLPSLRPQCRGRGATGGGPAVSRPVLTDGSVVGFALPISRTKPMRHLIGHTLEPAFWFSRRWTISRDGRRDDRSRPLTGVFATRSADRPNPIGLHRVRIVSIVDGLRFRVRDLEAVDGTPILDVKPVLRATEA
jgi:hypothetical protein